jgi:hypothetical protein
MAVISFGRITALDDEQADVIGCGRLRVAMVAKLAKQRGRGYGGWNDPSRCSIKRLERMLREHVDKGDMIDIANFAMMIWNRRNPMGKR